jgi:hypothetical protein
VIAVSCSGGGGGGGGNAGNHHGPGGGTTSTPNASAVPACDPAALKLTLSTDTTTYTSGQAPKLIAVFSNPTSSACRLTRVAADEIWTIKSGTPTVWTTKGCSSTSTPVKHTKILAGATKTISMFWNGHVRTSSCQPGGVAAAGTYTLHATLDGVVGKTAVFHITG